MDYDQARTRLLAERAEAAQSLREAESAAQEDRAASDDPGDAADAAQPLVDQSTDEDITESLQERLAAIDRALGRLDDGTYGLSVRSGRPIPDERLEADPAAELTVEEARQGR
jgi:DnaK suppressor protein